MSKVSRLLTTLLSVCMIIAFASLPVFAQAAPDGSGPEPLQQIRELPADVEYSAESAADTPTAPEQGVEDSDSVLPAEDEALAVPRKNANTPIYVGAGVAVAILGGVIVVCKLRGNK